MAEPYLEMLSGAITSLELTTLEGVTLECRHFFSGAALYANGKICASLTPAGFGLKLPVEVRDCLIQAGEGTELRYFEKAPVKKGYVALSQPVVDDRERLKSLLGISIDYVLGREVAGYKLA
jgi:TfoX/Sxy family transcriptional regulator of competence genes